MRSSPNRYGITFPDLLGQIDLEHEDRRLQKVEFAKEATVHERSTPRRRLRPH